MTIAVIVTLGLLIVLPWLGSWIYDRYFLIHWGNERAHVENKSNWPVFFSQRGVK